LKIKYENNKKSAKKNYALDKKEVYKTFGGTKPQSSTTVMDDEIIQMLQMEQVEGLPSIYVDDKVENVVLTIDFYEGNNSCRNEISMESFGEENSKWGKYKFFTFRSKQESNKRCMG
ncbi:hypothetical protein DOY81_011990, partial [Sarcophaga bullata]